MSWWLYGIGYVISAVLGARAMYLFREEMVNVELHRTQMDLAESWEEIRRLRAQVALLINPEQS